MHTHPRPGAPPGGTASRRVPALERSVIDDLLFLAAWERGLIPLPGALLRVRQIRRANPALVPAHDAALLKARPPSPARGTPPHAGVEPVAAPDGMATGRAG